MPRLRQRACLQGWDEMRERGVARIKGDDKNGRPRRHRRFFVRIAAKSAAWVGPWVSRFGASVV
jgi:hypothetical protein